MSLLRWWVVCVITYVACIFLPLGFYAIGIESIAIILTALMYVAGLGALVLTPILLVRWLVRLVRRPVA